MFYFNKCQKYFTHAKNVMYGLIMNSDQLKCEIAGIGVLIGVQMAHCGL